MVVCTVRLQTVAIPEQLKHSPQRTRKSEETISFIENINVPLRGCQKQQKGLSQLTKVPQ